MAKFTISAGGRDVDTAEDIFEATRIAEELAKRWSNVCVTENANQRVWYQISRGAVQRDWRRSMVT
jgi:hypothetical protein